MSDHHNLLSYHPAGRIDRKIEFPLPDEKTKRRIFNIHTSRMTLSDDVNLSEYIMAKDDLSGADIKVRLPHSFLRDSHYIRYISTLYYIALAIKTLCISFRLSVQKRVSSL